MVDQGLLRDLVEIANNRMLSSSSHDDELAILGVDHSRHRHQALTSVALSTAVWRDVHFAVGNADAEVQEPFNCGGGQARTVICDGQSSCVRMHADLGSNV